MRLDSGGRIHSRRGEFTVIVIACHIQEKQWILPPFKSAKAGALVEVAISNGTSKKGAIEKMCLVIMWAIKIDQNNEKEKVCTFSSSDLKMLKKVEYKEILLNILKHWCVAGFYVTKYTVEAILYKKWTFYI